MPGYTPHFLVGKKEDLLSKVLALTLSLLFLIAVLTGCKGPAATPTAPPVVRPPGAVDTFHMSMGEGLRFSEDKWKSM